MIVLVQCLRVNCLKREWCLDLPELTSIRFGQHAFCFKKDDESSELIMRSGYDEMKWQIDLPKLTTLTSVERSNTFCYPRSITLEGISYHSIFTIRHTLSQHCYSSSCIWEEKSTVLQEQSQPERMMNRHWCIDQSSKHAQNQSQCKHSFLGWIHVNRQ